MAPISRTASIDRYGKNLLAVCFTFERLRSVMRINRIISFFTSAYWLSRPDHLLEISSIRKAYVFAYFQYKKLFEDPFWNLAQRQPHIFRDGDILDIGANIGYTACVFAH